AGLGHRSRAHQRPALSAPATAAMLPTMQRVCVLWLLAVAATAQDHAGRGRILGRVVGPLRAPVPAARVWLETLDGAVQNASATTDGSGAFVLAHVPWGRWFVRSSIPGSNVGCHFVGLSPARPEAFAELRVGDAARIRGRVVDRDGRPVRGAHLVSENDVCFDWYIPEYTVRAVADDEGRFELDAVLLGPTTVRAWAPGFDLAEQRLHLAADSTLDFALTQGTGASVRVRLAATAGQRAAASVRVEYRIGRGHQLPLPLQRPALDADGSCLLAGLLPTLALHVHVDVPAAAVEPDPARLESADEAKQLHRTVDLRAVPQ